MTESEMLLKFARIAAIFLVAAMATCVADNTHARYVIAGSADPIATACALNINAGTTPNVLCVHDD